MYRDNDEGPPPRGSFSIPKNKQTNERWWCLARPRSPNRDKACQLWLESGKTRQLKDIAAELEVSEEQVRKWKNQDQWDKVTLQNTKSNVTKYKGGQLGNKNAAGHGAPKKNKNAAGHGAPEKNKNAVTTGEFETLLFDCLEPEERQLAQSVPADKEKLLLQEIQLLTVRERRMLKRIENLKQKDFTTVKKKQGTEKDKWTDLNEDHATLGQIQNIEDALTRVQARKQAAIDSLHRFGVDDAKLELELMKVELATMKLGGQDTETEDDGFLDALNAEVGSLWGDSDDD